MNRKTNKAAKKPVAMPADIRPKGSKLAGRTPKKAKQAAKPRTREGLTLLGERAAAPVDYAPELLEAFSNRNPDLDEMVTLRCPEFTTLCPVTGQPDFGELVIRYIPAKKLVESKVVLKDLRALLAPKYIEVRGRFRPRGGIAIHPFAAWAPKGGAYAAFATKRLFEEDALPAAGG